jgi:hypothetical protein
MIMERPENNKWLDEALTETIGSEKPRTDFEKWKQQHPEAVKMLTSRAKPDTERPLVLRRIIMNSKWIKLATAAVIVIAAGVVVGINIGQYFYMGRDDGGHHFISDDGQSVVTMDDTDVTDVEQTRNDLQEMKLLSSQGKRELIRVIEIRANSHLERRMFSYKYRLSDGRIREMGEAAPENAGQWTLTDAQQKEMRQLKEAGSGEDLGTYEDTVMNHKFEFNRQRYVLSDGTEIIWSIGEIKND